MDFTRDGNLLATASSDTTVRLWHAPPLDAVLREPIEVASLPPVETIRLFRLQVMGSAVASMATEGQVHRVDVTAIDGTDWHVQVQRMFDDLQEGTTYTVRFRAKAEATSSLGLFANIAEPDWHSIGLTSKCRCPTTGRPTSTISRRRRLRPMNSVVFNLGKRTGTVWIADVTLAKAAN